MASRLAQYSASTFHLVTAMALSIASLVIEYALQARLDLVYRFLLLFVLSLIILYIASSLQKRYAYPSFAEGALPYNLSIMRTDFRFPAVLEEFGREIFLAGPNQNHLLNAKQNSENLFALVNSLRDVEKKIHILIADPTSKPLMDMYGQVSAKGPGGFAEEESEILDSIAKLDDTVRTRLGQDALHRVRAGQLEIRATSHYLDSFCFIDPNTNHGKAYFMLVTKGTPGGSRPIYYFSERTDPILFSSYYQLYRENIYESAKILWPPQSPFRGA